MSFRFPEKEHEKLNNNPLREVVCQVKFPPILKISGDNIGNFQEAIRGDYPDVNIEPELLHRIFFGKESEDSKEEVIKNYIYRFTNTDGTKTVSLSKSFLALTANKYISWSDFRSDLEIIFTLLIELFNPSKPKRVGLRYINVLNNENTSLETLDDIIKLINSDLICTSTSCCWEIPQEQESRILLKDGNEKINIRFGFSKQKEDERFFILDFDYFEEQNLDFDNLITRIDQYHSKIYNAFRWSLKENAIDMFK